ncbi:MAG: hypothetical protein IKX35_08305, partial [Bacteroidales bacterium]|nr:hypothetical protein [Bacteroidales bacterium]
PGSNSSLYYCLALFFSESRVSASRRIAAPLCSLLGSYLASLRMPVLASDFQRTSRQTPFIILVSPSCLAGAKVLPFSESTSTFSEYFSKFFYVIDYQLEKVCIILSFWDFETYF